MSFMWSQYSSDAIQHLAHMLFPDLISLYGLVPLSLGCLLTTHNASFRIVLECNKLSPSNSGSLHIWAFCQQILLVQVSPMNPFLLEVSNAAVRSHLSHLLVFLQCAYSAPMITPLSLCLLSAVSFPQHCELPYSRISTCFIHYCISMKLLYSLLHFHEDFLSEGTNAIHIFVNWDPRNQKVKSWGLRSLKGVSSWLNTRDLLELRSLPGNHKTTGQGSHTSDA